MIEDHRKDLHELCRKFCVKRLEVFGSGLSDELFERGRSDLDFLVEFDAPDPVAHAKAYFRLLAALQDMFGCGVDLVETKAVENPYLLQSINATRSEIYAA